MEVRSYAPKIRKLKHQGGWLLGEKTLTARQFKKLRLGDLRYRPLAVLSEEALRSFVSLPEDSDAARRFLMTYGVFRLEDEFLKGPRFVKQFVKETSTKRRFAVGISLADFWLEQRNLKSILQSFTKLVQIRRPANAVARDLAASAVLSLVNQHLVEAKVSLTFREQAIRPAMVTYHVLPGLYALIYRQAVLKSPFGLCPRCGNLFKIDRPRKTYCSVSCQQAAKQARYRERVTSTPTTG